MESCSEEGDSSAIVLPPWKAEMTLCEWKSCWKRKESNLCAVHFSMTLFGPYSRGTILDWVEKVYESLINYDFPISILNEVCFPATHYGLWHIITYFLCYCIIESSVSSPISTNRQHPVSHKWSHGSVGIFLCYFCMWFPSNFVFTLGFLAACVLLPSHLFYFLGARDAKDERFQRRSDADVDNGTVYGWPAPVAVEATRNSNDRQVQAALGWAR